MTLSQAEWCALSARSHIKMLCTNSMTTTKNRRNMMISTKTEEAVATEPVAWTTRAQLDGIAGTANNGVMWGEPMPYHPDIPLYIHPTGEQGLREALADAEEFVAAVANENRPARAWAVELRAKISAALKGDRE
jgi:hypothetical protein